MKNIIDLLLIYVFPQGEFSLGGLLVFLVAAIIGAIIIFLTVFTVLSFISAQLISLFKLYANRVRESIDDFHPYTQSILQNQCPELARLKELKAGTVTKAIKAEMREIAASIIDTLNRNETAPIKAELVKQIRALV